MQSQIKLNLFDLLQLLHDSFYNRMLKSLKCHFEVSSSFKVKVTANALSAMGQQEKRPNCEGLLFLTIPCFFLHSVTTSRSVPARMANVSNSARNSPQVPHSLPAYQNSPMGTPRAVNKNHLLEGPRRGSNQSQGNLSLADRPAHPLPGSSSVPLPVPQGSLSQDKGSYMRMQSNSE